jgi:hypothetical protein
MILEWIKVFIEEKHPSLSGTTPNFVIHWKDIVA